MLVDWSRGPCSRPPLDTTVPPTGPPARAEEAWLWLGTHPQPPGPACLPRGAGGAAAGWGRGRGPAMALQASGSHQGAPDGKRGDRQLGVRRPWPVPGSQKTQPSPNRLTPTGQRTTVGHTSSRGGGGLPAAHQAVRRGLASGCLGHQVPCGRRQQGWAQAAVSAPSQATSRGPPDSPTLDPRQRWAAGRASGPTCTPAHTPWPLTWELGRDHDEVIGVTGRVLAAASRVAGALQEAGGLGRGDQRLLQLLHLAQGLGRGGR